MIAGLSVSSAEKEVMIMSDIAASLTQIQSDIARAQESAPAAAAQVNLVAVSKQQPDEKIEAACAAGHRLFGENRVQEAASHWHDRRLHMPDLQLHLIGPLQSNKAAEAVALFDVIETIDREKIAKAVAAECQKQGKEVTCFVQVNTGKEPQKAGIMPEEAVAFVSHCQQVIGLSVTGLMCIPPVTEEAAMHFALLKKLGQEAGLAHLSMGMSGDFEEAIAFGADYVRVGSAIFGERLPR